MPGGISKRNVVILSIIRIVTAEPADVFYIPLIILDWLSQ